jgi:hypothetical protein
LNGALFLFQQLISGFFFALDVLLVGCLSDKTLLEQMCLIDGHLYGF